MMVAGEIEQQLRLGEDSKSEFKSVAHSGYLLDPKALGKTVAAFANSGGGRLVIGVEGDGTPSGIGDALRADTLMRQVSQVCSDAVRPGVTCGIVKVEVRGVPLLVVDVPAFSPGRPYRSGGVVYVRDANRSREASREELVRLLESADFHFDEQPIADATIEDLDSVAVEDFLRTVYGPGELARGRDAHLRALKCIDAAGVPTVAGLLSFARDVGRWLVDARISAVRFPGTTMSGEFVDRKEIGGRLPQQLEAAVAFLDAHVVAPSRVEGWERREAGIPPAVLREALNNALVHRDYRAAAQVRLFVFDDRIEIVNPGGLLNQLTLDSIRLGGISQRRNPVVATLLARIGKRENIGLGVPEMIRLMKERGLPEPEFDLPAGQFRVTLRLSPRDGR